MREITNNQQLFFGEKSFDRIPALLNWYGVKKAFVVAYDKNAEVFALLSNDLQKVGINTIVYDAVVGEPDLHMINGGRDIYVGESCDCIIAVGGGSVIDTAKAIGMLCANGGLIEQYQMEGKKVTKPSPLFIAVPTTSGTGAEATKVSVVTNNYNGLKKSVYHTSMIADIVVLDPALTVGLGKKITAATGMDALSHAIESYVSLNANPLSEMYGLKAMKLISQSLVNVVNNPESIPARADMMLGSYLGGCAITAGIGIAHILAQPVGAMFKIPHGDACSIFLPLSMEMNLDYATAKYARIAEALGVAVNTRTDRDNAFAAIEKVREIRSAINAPDILQPYLQKQTYCMDDVINVVMKTTGHITCNPRPLTPELIEEMFTKAL